MISFCTLVRDTPHLDKLIKMFKDNYKGEHEICIGDNSKYRVNREKNKKLADVYVRITDKELFRMGIPWGHNRIVAEANSYKIFYVDSDEYPIWVDPNLDDKLDTVYIPAVVRADFLTMEEINTLHKQNLNIDELAMLLGHTQRIPQDRIYNARYAKFEGVCHAIFHAPQHFRGNEPVAILLHNKTVRERKDMERMRDIIREQFVRQKINPSLASSTIVLEWGPEYTEHKYENYQEFINAHENKE